MSIPRPEHPRPDFLRADWLNLNGCWTFDFDDLDHPDLDQHSHLRRQITVPFSWTAPLSGIAEDRKGLAWYARSVAWQPQRPSDHVWLCFMAVDYDCEVFVNGTCLGRHRGGYDPFSFDASAVWQNDAENRIAVRVIDQDLPSQTSGKQGYGQTRGIWQTVYLEARPEKHIESLRIEARLDGRVRVLINEETPERADALVELCCDFGREAQGGAEFCIAEPKLWSPEQPYLYEGSVRYGEDTVHTYFGIREIATARYGERLSRWITLNGRPIYLNGVLDQSYHPQGHFTLPSEQEIIDEVQRLKQLGLNLVRIHIKPEDPRKLYWLDKMGMLVMADMACFWGEPLPETRRQYEQELFRFLQRDRNHPSIIAWVIFNETWGLFSEVQGKRIYSQETQAWVLDLYRRVKAFDPSRLVEDNSPCNYDHLESDLNSWHFYINGYRAVMDHIRDAVSHTYPGSSWNYVRGYKQSDAPLLNSECGMVWGVNGSAGESDIAWHYHYMLNEYRLHDTICGFIFTEFHDVINEFNGYYRLHHQAKDFGYQELCPGMRIADLHAADFVAYDAPPCRSVGPGERVRTRLVHSNFDATSHGEELLLQWQLGHEGLDGSVIDDQGELRFPCRGYGAQDLGDIEARMPEESAVAVLSWQLLRRGEILSRNFTCFDVRGPQPGIQIRPAQHSGQDWQLHWQALDQHKICGAGEGSYRYRVDLSPLLSEGTPEKLTLCLEAGAKRVLKKDAQQQQNYQTPANMFTSGAFALDPGENPNSYFMSDDSRFTSQLRIVVNGQAIHSQLLPNDPADSRGILSWHYQQRDRQLDEAGSYGYLVRAPLPESLMAQIRTGLRQLDIELHADNGLAIYGRNAGRYAIDIVIA